MYTSNTVHCFNCRVLLQLQADTGGVHCTRCHAYTHAALPPPSNHHMAPDYLSLFPHNHAPPSHYPSPSPYYHAPPGPPPNPYGPKRAVVVGISYRNSRHEIKECNNFAKLMRSLLIKNFDYPDSSIILLTEEYPDGSKLLPIKKNIKMAMHWLVEGCQPGDSLVFYFCGHGSQQRDYSGDEVDGYNETLCPLDFETDGEIVDDEINATIVKPIPPGVRLHALIDASHSGTVLDLPFLCKTSRKGKYEWEDHRPKSAGVWKGSSGGEVICFSGCADNEAYDNKVGPSNMTSTGAMTICFIHAVLNCQGATYGSILVAMRNAIRNAGKGGGITGEHVSHSLTILGTASFLLTLGADCGILGSVLALVASSSALFLTEIKKIFRALRQVNLNRLH
ncbi:Caspase domain [Sesbania bispinosa]|nr:Caspase domain [Sesbania bispinosa]